MEGSPNEGMVCRFTSQNECTVIVSVRNQYEVGTHPDFSTTWKSWSDVAQNRKVYKFKI